MKNRKSTFVKTLGKLGLLAGVLGAMTAIPQISSAATAAKPKATVAMKAKKATKAKKAASKTTQVTGTITAIKGDVLKLAPVQKNKKGASVTVKASAKTKVTINGKSAKLSQLKVGEKVTAKSTGSVVTSITSSVAKKAVAKKAATKKGSTKPAKTKK
ncbi:MAG: hypothetical protein ABI210_12430 [Abditibacteriaceae bacterium]